MNVNQLKYKDRGKNICMVKKYWWNNFNDFERNDPLYAGGVGMTRKHQNKK